DREEARHLAALGVLQDDLEPDAVQPRAPLQVEPPELARRRLRDDLLQLEEEFLFGLTRAGAGTTARERSEPHRRQLHCAAGLALVDGDRERGGHRFGSAPRIAWTASEASLSPAPVISR